MNDETECEAFNIAAEALKHEQPESDIERNIALACVAEERAKTFRIVTEFVQRGGWPLHHAADNEAKAFAEAFAAHAVTVATKVREAVFGEAEELARDHAKGWGSPGTLSTARTALYELADELQRRAHATRDGSQSTTATKG